jgi:hypothetical protein
MARDLSRKELQAALDKLRTQYNRYGEQYDRQVFNLDRFNERWLESIRIGMPAGHFLAGEVETFRELVKKAEEKYAPPDRTISDKVDRMLEDFADRIGRYPAHALCPRADEETCRLAGPCSCSRSSMAGSCPRRGSLPPAAAAPGWRRRLRSGLSDSLSPVRAGCPG